MKLVYKIKHEGTVLVVDSIEELLATLKAEIEETEEYEEKIFSITPSKMTEEQLKQMPEFDGW